jgi:hypothetical protein
MTYWLQKRPLYNEADDVKTFTKELDQTNIQNEFLNVPKLLAQAVGHFESKPISYQAVEHMQTTCSR